MAELNFESYEFVEGTNNEYDLLPDGWYSASIKEVDLRTTKAGNGNYLNVRYDIMGPTHAGRVVFGMITVRNPNQTAERIGREQLSSLAAAIGMKEMPHDTDELVGGTLMINVKTRKSEQYGDSNEVKDFKSSKSGELPKADKPADKPADNSAPF